MAWRLADTPLGRRRRVDRAFACPRLALSSRLRNDAAAESLRPRRPAACGVRVSLTPRCGKAKSRIMGSSPCAFFALSPRLRNDAAAESLKPRRSAASGVRPLTHPRHPWRTRHGEPAKSAASLPKAAEAVDFAGFPLAVRRGRAPAATLAASCPLPGFRSNLRKGAAFSSGMGYYPEAHTFQA